jgi:hypothetical protein
LVVFCDDLLHSKQVVGNPLEHPPADIAEGGALVILAYLEMNGAQTATAAQRLHIASPTSSPVPSTLRQMKVTIMSAVGLNVSGSAIGAYCCPWWIGAHSASIFSSVCCLFSRAS